MIELITKLEQELIKNQLIKVDEFKINLPASQQEIVMAEDFLQINLKNTHFHYFNGLAFKWEALTQEKINDWGFAGGHSKLLPLSEICTSWLDNLYFEEDSSMSDFYPIDFHTNEICFGIVKGSNKMYWHYAGEEDYSNLGITLEDYIKQLTYSKGFYYWHYSLIEKKQKTTKKRIELEYYEQQHQKLFKKS